MFWTIASYFVFIFTTFSPSNTAPENKIDRVAVQQKVDKADTGQTNSFGFLPGQTLAQKGRGLNHNETFVADTDSDV